MKKIYYNIKYYFLIFLNIIRIKKRSNNYPDWDKLLESKFKKKDSKIKQKILIATSTGGHKIALSTEMIFGFSLDLKGADVEYLLCDQSLSACSLCTHAQYESEDEFNIIKAKKNCVSCWSIGNAYIKRSKFKINKFSDFIDQKDLNRIDKILDEIEISKIKNFKIDNISVGEHAYSGVLRYFARGQIPNTINSKNIYVEYFKSALITYFMSVNLFSKKKYDKVLLNHGIYTPQGIICDVANKFNVKVVTWYTSYRKKTVTLSHKGTYHKTLLNDEYRDWENIILDENKLQKLDQYLSSRRYGRDDWIYFQGKNQYFDIEKYFKKNNINTKKKIVSIFTNVIWDAQLYYEQNIFNDIIEWCNETINFLKDKDVTVLLRIHPAELSGSMPSNQKIYNEIINRFKKLPSNIHIIQPDDALNSYSIIDKSSLCIVYASTIANEIAAMGKPIVVGGEAYIKNKGISYDPKSKKEYFQFINELLEKPQLDENIKLRAKKYAYYFYFQRMIPIDLIKITKTKNLSFMIDLQKVKKMIKGDYFDKGLDIICDGILNGKEFIYTEEK